MAAGPHPSQPSSSSSFSPLVFSLPVLPVGAQQPESFIGYFTTACVAIVLAIFSYILLPRMVRLCRPGGEGCRDTEPFASQHKDHGALAPQPWLLPASTPPGSGQALPCPGELHERTPGGLWDTSRFRYPQYPCGNEALGEQESISIGQKWKEYFPILHLPISPTSAITTEPLAAFFPYA